MRDSFFDYEEGSGHRFYPARWPARNRSEREGQAMRRKFATALGIIILPLVAFAQVGQQAAEISGTVTDARTGVRLVGANVLIVGTVRGAATDADGNYRIGNASVGSITVAAHYIGYKSSQQETTVVAGQSVTLNFALGVSALTLDEVVITGTGQEVTKRSLATTISTVRAADTENMPIQSLGEMLTGRTAGVMAMSTTGTAGGAIRIRVRGMTSLSVSNEPIVYVDGIQVDNAAFDPSGFGFNYLGGQEQSRLGDINPDDIDRIEIVKGSAAATLYGTTAANGVIQIFTKRGALNSKARWTFETEQGYSNYDPEIFTYPEESFSYTAPFSATQNEIIDVTSFGGKLLRESMIGQGAIESYSLSVRGGGEAITYYVAGRSSREAGAFMPGTNTNRFYSGKANVELHVSDKLSLATTNSISYNRQRAVNNDNHVFGYMAQALLSVGDTSAAAPRGEALYDLDKIDKIQNLNETFRYTGSVQFKYRPDKNWSNRLLFGLDLTSAELGDFIPFGAGIMLVPLGERLIDGRKFWSLTLDASSVYRARLGNIGFATSVGAQGFLEDTKLVSAGGEDFPFTGLSTIAGTGFSRAWESRFRSVNAGFYIQEVIDLSNSLYITGAVRTDGNSAFGDEFQSQTYPKLGVSYVLDNFSLPLLGSGSLKLRVAQGSSGSQPGVFAKDRTFEPNSLASAAGLTSSNVGDKELKPEVSTELEVGFDLSFLDERWGLEFTLYNQRTIDALVFKQIAPSTGFAGFQQSNIGEVSNNGLELFLRGLIIHTATLKWDLRFSYSASKNNVVSLGDAAVPVGNLGGVNRNEEGYPVASLWARGLRSDTVAIVSGGVRAVPVPAVDAGDPALDGIRILDGKQVVTAGNVYIGPSLPLKTGYLRNDITLFGNFRFSFLVDWTDGHWMYNSTREFQFEFGNLKKPELTPYEVQYYTNKLATVGFGGLEPNEKKRLIDLARLDDREAYNMMSPANFIKLREISASYTFRNVPGLESLTLVAAGRNLWTASPYNGPDPEVNWSGASSTQSNGVDFLTTPSPRRFTLMLRASF